MPADRADRRGQPLQADRSHSAAAALDCIRVILDALHGEAGLARILHGPSWILASVRSADGRHASGMAGVPHDMRDCCRVPERLTLSARLPEVHTSIAKAGDSLPIDVHFDPATEAAGPWAALLESWDAGEAAIGLAVANAMLALDPAPSTALDGVAWLLERAVDRSVAVVGHFPFADRRLRPIARQVWIIERDPGEGEVGGVEAESILAGAEIVVITGSAVANHTIDDLLVCIHSQATVMMLGPSTPLVPRLLEQGFHALSGVRVADEESVAHGVAAGDSFRRMAGLHRVTITR